SAEVQDLGYSCVLKVAQWKLRIVESEASKSGDILQRNLDKIRARIAEALKEVFKSKMAGKLREELNKTARGVGETLLEGCDEMDSQTIDSRVYCIPVELQKRIEISQEDSTTNVEEPNRTWRCHVEKLLT
uniref:Uncharacterized protein n=1 Tax=Anopheles culicifacies TaxID=139723 RepID=A0A182MQQ3_9DIPT